MPPRPWAPAGDQKTLPLEVALQEREPNEKAMQAIQIALSDPEMDAETVASCAEKISEWLRRQSQSTQKMILQCRLNPVIVQVLKLHGTDVEVARYCCRIVHGIANRSADNMAALCKAGVVLGLNEVLDYHLGDAEVQEFGTQAMEILAARSGAREIVATGGIARLLRILAEHPNNSYVQRACWSCMDLTVSNCGPLNQAMREEIIGAAELVHRATSILVLSKHPVDKATRKRAEKLANYVQNCAQEHKRLALVPAKPKESERQMHVEEAKAPEREDLGLRAWLEGIDRSGSLAQYHSVLAQNFDSVAHVVDVYSEGGKLDAQFFEDLGITKLGHRRKFEQWFQRYYDEGVAVAA